MDQTVLKVSDVLALVNQTLEFAYPHIIVEGEVASFKISKGKYIFFDMKDDEGALSCFMMAYSLRQPLEDGMRIRVSAQPRLTAWGKFSLNVRQVIPVGEGSIKRAFELLKSSLQKEGLFDQARKRTLPKISQRVALIASVESAGYADFIKILNHRWGGVEVEVADVHVQGMAAAQHIVQAITFFNQSAQPPDVLVIVRGGGSADDLMTFNDEYVVRAIAQSRIPTLVGVGHETDTTLADLAADVRAATPSNAAQILVPDRHALLAYVQQQKMLLHQKTAGRLAESRSEVRNAVRAMFGRIAHDVSLQKQRVLHARRMLAHVNPEAVLKRGYAIVRVHNKVVKNTTQVKAGDTVTITVADGIIQAGVIDGKNRTNP